eukprot:scaffold437_cov168-Ochromonas_danica.AAC.66
MLKLFLLAAFLLVLLSARSQEVEIDTNEFGELGSVSTTLQRPRELAAEFDPVLMRAASHGDSALVTEFLRGGTSPNERNIQGWTALIFAVANGYQDIAQEGDVEMVEILLSHGATLRLRNRADLCAFELAGRGGHAALASFLGRQSLLQALAAKDLVSILRHVREGAPVNLANQAGWTSLIFATAQGATEVVFELLFLGADPNQAELDGWTPLLFAANNDFVEIVRSLLERGAQVDHQAKNGWTAISLAQSRGTPAASEVITLLESHSKGAPASQEEAQATSDSVNEEWMREQEGRDHDFQEQQRQEQELREQLRQEQELREQQRQEQELREQQEKAKEQEEIKEQQQKKREQESTESRRKRSSFLFWN